MEDPDDECDVCGADPSTGEARVAPLEELDPPEGFLDDQAYDDFVHEDLEGEDVEAKGGPGCVFIAIVALIVGGLIAWIVSGGRSGGP